MVLAFDSRHYRVTVIISSRDVRVVGEPACFRLLEEGWRRQIGLGYIRFVSTAVGDTQHITATRMLSPSVFRGTTRNLPPVPHRRTPSLSARRLVQRKWWAPGEGVHRRAVRMCQTFPLIFRLGSFYHNRPHCQTGENYFRARFTSFWIFLILSRGRLGFAPGWR